MASLHVTRSSLQGTITVPSSKSHTLRAILFAALASGKSVISHPLISNDAEAMMRAVELLGAKIVILPSGSLEIEGLSGKIPAAEDVISAGNSGIVLRFISALAALSPHYTVITGDASIRHQRPIQPLLNALTQLGAFAVSTKDDGFAPVIIRGPMTNDRAILSGHDSQPVSALLIAAAFRNRPTELIVGHPGEIPWIMLTLEWLDRLGIRYRCEQFERYQIEGNSEIAGFEYSVPGDFSTAAFPIVAALATNSELTLDNMDMQDSQGDKEFIFALQQMGARIEIDESAKTITVKPGSRLQGIEVDINDFIDAIPAMAVAGCLAEGETRLFNAAVARQKECDRLHSMTVELKKMGAAIEEFPDSLVIRQSRLKGAKLSSHHDHRTAMALVVASLGATGESTIEDAACIAKTWPDFTKEMTKLGAAIEVGP
ncbi:MAG: 3-phosphoshikimate 1-carboxyvinyltransferase [Parachlamydia sp.]|nr:3-phosphoshikimate 1-carboxyvinyltransferase [Parachlamydia sp.]